MKTLVLNGERAGENSLSLVQETIIHVLSLEGSQVHTVLLREEKIARCKGCFGCWTKSPGVCVIDDYGRDLAKMAVQCDLMIYLTPITFGGYSSELKKAVDRFACPMLLPFFTTIDDEVHHKARYQPLPSLVGIGILQAPDNESEAIFKELIKRNAVNLHSPATQAIVYYNSHDQKYIEEEMKSVLRKIKA